MEEEGNEKEEKDVKKELEKFHSKMTPLMLKYPDKLKIVSSMSFLYKVSKVPLKFLPYFPEKMFFKITKQSGDD